MTTLTDESTASLKNLNKLFEQNSFIFNKKVIKGSVVKTLLSIPGPLAYRYDPDSGKRYGKKFSMDSLGSNISIEVGKSSKGEEDYEEINQFAIDYLQEYFSKGEEDKSEMSKDNTTIKELIPSLSFHIANNMGPYMTFLTTDEKGVSLEQKLYSNLGPDIDLNKGLKGYICYLLSIEYNKVNDMLLSNFESSFPSFLSVIKEKMNEDLTFPSLERTNFFSQLILIYKILEKNERLKSNSSLNKIIVSYKNMFQSF